MTQNFWAWRSKPAIKPYGPMHCVGPFETREDAVKAAFEADKRTVEVGSGYGPESPVMDLRWKNRFYWERGQ